MHGPQHPPMPQNGPARVTQAKPPDYSSQPKSDRLGLSRVWLFDSPRFRLVPGAAAPGRPRFRGAGAPLGGRRLSRLRGRSSEPQLSSRGRAGRGVLKAEHLLPQGGLLGLLAQDAVFFWGATAGGTADRSSAPSTRWGHGLSRLVPLRPLI